MALAFTYYFVFFAGDATVTISHRYTPKEQLRQHTRIADIVVAAAGMDPLLLLKIYFYLV
jgi:5,10-methylene-tetrahydrofolate dehydrogenase/methenyl tetrahydrofolate cyclohydrolase